MAYTKYMKYLQKSQVVFNHLPAIVIGGPPHSGKSVLAYSLTQALRERDVLHYLMLAYPPDYEGDWFLGAKPKTANHLQRKGTRSESWLPILKRDVARRHVPLIVNMGGRPTPEQEMILDHCTHSILLTPNDEARQEWTARFARHGLVPLAELRSDLHGENRLEQKTPFLQGTLAGLERGRRAKGAVFDELVAKLVDIFTIPGLRRRHLENSPIELWVDLEHLARRMERDPNHWQPQDLPAVLDYLPAQESLALYGRGSNWLYAAVAACTLPASFFLFDVRLGWVEAPTIARGAPDPEGLLWVEQHSLPDAQLFEFRIPDAYLDITEADELLLPPCSAEGVILSGRLSHWLWAALARTCDAPWVAVVQPQVQGAVVVKSHRQGPKVGTVIAVLGVTS